MEKKIPDNIISEIMKRDCLLFIGAGLSIEAGLPSGKDLAEKLLDILKKEGYSNTSDLSLPRISQDFETSRSRQELEKIIREEIVNRMDKCNPVSYKLLSELEPLPIDIISTNYDSLLEDALGKQNYTPIFQDLAISRHSSSTTNLFKIHGDIDRLEEAIITEEDIRNFKHKRPSILKKMEALFQEKQIIFLGFSIEDRHIRDLYKEVKDKLQDHAPSAYVVSPGDDNQLRFEEIGVKQIKLKAKDFLSTLLNKIDNKGRTTLPFEIPQSPKPNYNPFSIYSTEYFPDRDREKLINETFIEPINFASIIEPGNTIIEGHRGSGKSMILKYLSYEAQIKRNFKEKWDENYIGIYLKFKPTLVDTTKIDLFKGGDTSNWIHFFLSYVNLLIGEEIIRTLKLSYDNGNILIDSENDFVSEVIFLFFESVPNLNKEMTLKNLLFTITRVRNDFAQKHFSDWNLPSDYLEQLTSIIYNHVNEWSGKNFFFLLDEYDNLDSNQQKVVNTLIKNRSFSYKVGVKLFDMVYESISGKILERNNDYTYVNTDRFDSEYNKFEDFVRNVANKRLEAYGYENTIEQILPAEENENKIGFENRDYSGFKNIVRLSSGIVRDFLELCKDMVYYSNIWVLEEERNKLDIITPNIQNTVIKVHSNLLYEHLYKITGYDKDSMKSRSSNARLLINNLAKIFQNIFVGSKSKEERKVTGFQLKNPDMLNQTTKNALYDAVSYRSLQVPLNPRRPQEIKDVPSERYKFHRLLCPKFRLALADRWPKDINAEVFNETFINPDKSIKEITKYFINNIPPNITKDLMDFDEGEK